MCTGDEPVRGRDVATRGGASPEEAGPRAPACEPEPSTAGEGRGPRPGDRCPDQTGAPASLPLRPSAARVVSVSWGRRPSSDTNACLQEPAGAPRAHGPPRLQQQAGFPRGCREVSAGSTLAAPSQQVPTCQKRLGTRPAQPALSPGQTQDRTGCPPQRPQSRTLLLPWHALPWGCACTGHCDITADCRQGARDPDTVPVTPAFSFMKVGHEETVCTSVLTALPSRTGTVGEAPSGRASISRHAPHTAP